MVVVSVPRKTVYPPNLNNSFRIALPEGNDNGGKSGAASRTPSHTIPTTFHSSIRNSVVCFETRRALFSLLYVHVSRFGKRNSSKVSGCSEDEAVFRVLDAGKRIGKKSCVDQSVNLQVHLHSTHGHDIYAFVVYELEKRSKSDRCDSKKERPVGTKVKPRNDRNSTLITLWEC